jgi:RecA/RadA recombinase
MPDPGAIDNQEIAGAQHRRQVGKSVVGHVGDSQEAGSIPRLDRALGDGLGRQFIFEIGGPHSFAR